MDDRALTDRYFAFLIDAWTRYDREGSRIVSPLTWPILRRVAVQPRRPVLARAVKAVKAARPERALVTEFGVYRGTSINYLARRLPGAEIYGFDSFRGFPEDGRSDWRQDFSVDTKPVVPAHVTLVEGMFDDTLPGFAAGLPPGRTIDLVHIDCDIYSSTKCVFDILGDRIVDGTVVVFDELLHYGTAFENEFLAFHEFLDARGLGFRWLAKAGALRPLADEVKGRIGPGLRSYRRAGYFQNAAVVIVRDPDRDARFAAVAGEAAVLAAAYRDRPQRRRRKRPAAKPASAA